MSITMIQQFNHKQQKQKGEKQNVQVLTSYGVDRRISQPIKLKL